MEPSLPPGPREPAALQTLEWLARPTALLRRCAGRYGEAFTLRLSFDDAPLVLVWHPDAVRAVYSADPAVARRSGSPGPLGPVAGPRSILFSDGDEHLRIRRLMLAAFGRERMAGYRAIVREVAARAVARWPRGRPVELLGRMQELTLDIVLRTVFGTRDPRLAADVRDTLATTRSLPRMAALSLTSERRGPRSPWGGFLGRVHAIDAQLDAIVAARRASGAAGDDVLGALLAAGLDDAEVRDHLVTLVAAGHETTAGSLAWALERLARAPGALARIRGGDEAWLGAVIRETLRIRPVLTVAPRKLAAPLQVGGRGCPRACTSRRASTSCTAAPTSTPTRRAGAPSAGWAPRRRQSFAWIPFGGGVRRCLGAAFATMEMEEVLRAVAARLALAPGDARGERMRRRGITLQPGRGARVVLSGAS